MRRGPVLLGAGLAAAGALFGIWLFAGPDVQERALSDLEGDVERGAYVARLAGCIPCHTDPESGRGVLAGGPALETEFGTFYGPNITPHETDGVGAWSVEDFARALTSGESPDGAHYYPAFPYAFYSRLTNQDVVDLWAAVNSVPAVSGAAPAHEVSFPFDQRWTLGAWKRLALPKGGEAAAQALDRGAYLAEAAAHCGACHTPRDPLGRRDRARRYEGAQEAGGGKVPAITADALREAGWTEDDLIYALQSGITPDGDVFGGSMADVVNGGTQFWRREDLSALADYLLTDDS